MNARNQPYCSGAEELDSSNAYLATAFHVAGHWDADGSQMAEAIQRVVARRSGRRPRVTAFPWWLLTLVSPVVATFREMREMRYLWREPVRMDSARLIAALGHEPHTPLDEAVEATLVGLGCLTASASSEARALVGEPTGILSDARCFLRRLMEPTPARPRPRVSSESVAGSGTDEDKV